MSRKTTIRCRIFLLLLPVFSFSTSIAQRKTDHCVFLQVIKADTLAGLKFRLQASLRVERLDSVSQAGIWFRVDKPENKIGFFKNTYDDPVTSPDWKTRTIEGKIDKDAGKIVFGGLFMGKGRFYYDDFRLTVFRDGKWEPVSLQNPGFENAEKEPGWIISARNQRVPLTVTSTNVTEGRQAFWYNGENNSSPVSYGSNADTGRYAAVNGIRLYYEIYGQGEPLLLLHGNSQSISEFEAQIDFFRKDYRVIAVDTRGQGRSTEDGTRYTYQLFAKDMHDFLDHLKLDSVNIIGWSDGGNTGLIMAMQYPAKVKRLATMGANVFINTDAVQAAVIKEVKKQIKVLEKDSAGKKSNDLRLMKLLLEEPNMTFEDLHSIHCPVLVMAGENDLIRDKHTRGIAEHISGSQLVIFPKGTHYMPQENAKAFNQAVLDFLKKP